MLPSLSTSRSGAGNGVDSCARGPRIAGSRRSAALASDLRPPLRGTGSTRAARLEPATRSTGGGERDLARNAPTPRRFSRRPATRTRRGQSLLAPSSRGRLWARIGSAARRGGSVEVRDPAMARGEGPPRRRSRRAGHARTARDALGRRPEGQAQFTDLRRVAESRQRLPPLGREGAPRGREPARRRSTGPRRTAIPRRTRRHRAGAGPWPRSRR